VAQWRYGISILGLGPGAVNDSRGTVQLRRVNVNNHIHHVRLVWETGALVLPSLTFRSEKINKPAPLDTKTR